MDTLLNSIPHRKIKVTVLSTYNLICSSLQCILETERQLSVLATVRTSSELFKRISHCKPDVILICLLENEGKKLNVITDVLAAEPQIKIVILSSPNSLLNQAEALRLGVSAIVGADQSPLRLLRAIKQAATGKVQFYSKTIARFDENDFNLSANAGYKRAHYYKSDDLTKRELEVVKMIGLGLSNKSISKKLYIGETTVRQHLSSIYSKLDVEDRLNLAVYAYRHRIIAPVAA